MITARLNLKNGATAAEIFEAIRAQRRVELSPEVPTLDTLLKESGLDRASLQRASELVAEAISRGADILVYGDYDADGLTATAIMWTTLRGLAKDSRARILPFIPDRHRHGYGLSAKSLEDIHSKEAFRDTAYPDFTPSLIITVDTGIVASREIASLVEGGIEVIITDHHLPSESLPPASCIVHSTTTSGAGVAWITALYLADAHPAVARMIDLATLGIVADQMPLTGLNRSIVKSGLKELAMTKNLGLQALQDIAGIKDRPVTAYDLSFALAPRLNAVGRLDNPNDGLRLLCTRNKQVASSLASTIDSHNHRRQELTDTMIAEALKVRPTHNLIFTASKSYHEGVIGLVAGKLAETYHRPAVVVAVKDGVCKGSARSVPGVSVTAILRQFSNLFISLGGHDQASGFSLDADNLSTLEHSLYDYADNHIQANLLKKSYLVDCYLPLDSCTLELAKLLKQLEPYGLGNPKPKFASKSLLILDSHSLKDGRHHKLTVEKSGTKRELLWFNSPGQGGLKSIKALTFSLDINAWQGREVIQLIADYVQT